MSETPNHQRAREAIETMQREHALEIELVRELQESLSAGDLEESQRLFTRLEEFTAAHFRAEQLMMSLHGYPASEVHREEHERLIAELHALGDQLAGDTPTDRAAAVARLERWLFAHMGSEDQALADFLAGQAKPAND